MDTPEPRIRARCGMPRIDPVPTAPAPPIWKTDFGLIPPTASARRSVRRKWLGRSGFFLPGRPQKGGSHSTSQRSPSLWTIGQKSGADVAPSSRTNQAGIEKAKSRPATAVGSAERCAKRRSTAPSRESAGAGPRRTMATTGPPGRLLATFHGPQGGFVARTDIDEARHRFRSPDLSQARPWVIRQLLGSW